MSIFSKVQSMLNYGQEVATNSVATVAPVETPKNIGEPVLAIIESLKNSTDWKQRKGDRWETYTTGRSTVKIEHISSGLVLGFTRYTNQKSGGYMYLNHDTWVTGDESTALGKAFEVYLEDLARVNGEYRHMLNQVEREKFMKVFVKENK